jgi:hypothetical protein
LEKLAKRSLQGSLAITSENTCRTSTAHPFPPQPTTNAPHFVKLDSPHAKTIGDYQPSAVSRLRKQDRTDFQN